jgi:hypothetical protein
MRGGESSGIFARIIRPRRCWERGERLAVLANQILVVLARVDPDPDPVLRLRGLQRRGETHPLEEPLRGDRARFATISGC